MKRVDSKGLSTIIATLIIIVLVFVAVALLWFVIKNLVSGGTSHLDLSSKCIDTTITPTKVNNMGSGNYDITILRSRGEDEIGGVKIIFTGEGSRTNFIHDVPGNIGGLEIKTVNINVQDVSNPDKVEVVVYFTDASGNYQYCQGGESIKI